MKNVVIRFCGDSGDGMQLTGNLFSSLSAILGDEISTLPDFPAEIRAPQGTLGGVSGFQVCLGKNVYTPGDKADVLVAMNSAALKVAVMNKHFHNHAIIIVDTDSFTPQDLEKALYKTDNPFTELGIPETVQIVPVALTTLTKESLKNSGLDAKSILKSRNMFALGLVCWLFDRPIDKAIHFLEGKFAKKPALIAPNTKVLVDGHNYGQNLALSIAQIRLEATPGERPSDGVEASPVKKGAYTSIAGNKATAWGLIAAAEKAGKKLFLGSYPITPATDIMHELAARKDMGVMVVQAEDEIAGVCTAIGASFAGDLAATSTSGPGLSLKSEAIGLAVMAELPLVVIDVQRGGPSTGLPTKTEQTDLMQAMYGRNGECPAVVMAASTSANCFEYAYMASKIALEHNTPVILLTDTYLANGTALWRIPEMKDLPAISPIYRPAGSEGETFRKMGLEHDIVTGAISTNPENHEKMIKARAAKIAGIEVPDLKVWSPNGSLPLDGERMPKAGKGLLVGWGSTEGHLKAAAEQLGCDLAHFNYINPLPANTHEVLAPYDRIVVCELNSGQFVQILRAKFPDLKFEQYNEMKGQPFSVEHIVEYVQR